MEEPLLSEVCKSWHDSDYAVALLRENQKQWRELYLNQKEYRCNTLESETHTKEWAKSF